MTVGMSRERQWNGRWECERRQCSSLVCAAALTQAPPCRPPTASAARQQAEAKAEAPPPFSQQVRQGHARVCVCACAYVCVHECACVSACVRVCVCVCMIAPSSPAHKARADIERGAAGLGVSAQQRVSAAAASNSTCQREKKESLWLARDSSSLYAKSPMQRCQWHNAASAKARASEIKSESESERWRHGSRLCTADGRSLEARANGVLLQHAAPTGGPAASGEQGLWAGASMWERVDGGGGGH